MTRPEGPLFGFGDTAVACYRERLLGRLGLSKAKAGSRALDLGCGEGKEALYFARLGYRVEAVDQQAHPDWARVARESGRRVSFKVGDAERIRRPSGSFDLVFEKDMLHHAGDPEEALREMRRLCRRGGKVVVVEANRWNPIFYVHLTLLGGHEHFSIGRLRALLEGAGMGSAVIRRCEARVWPINRRPFQRLMDWVQDLVESLPLLRGLACYHLAIWESGAAE
jgi:SAM-dependent methyltransferase